ncbi:hypothetical protein QBC37DRAFT_403984 [Rhypophila decipiens]|uniref:Ferric oxidoreductase domain-containing protein n=1 Tax=Rhypophila decipiens TaxID=261697 RepID=A0AAN6XZV8_9PEZI|nr:hypothetical protein QBC37DRAFT_403984 [Rhypophila decipiens]
MKLYLDTVRGARMLFSARRICARCGTIRLVMVVVLGSHGSDNSLCHVKAGQSRTAGSTIPRHVIRLPARVPAQRHCRIQTCKRFNLNSNGYEGLFPVGVILLANNVHHGVPHIYSRRGCERSELAKAWRTTNVGPPKENRHVQSHSVPHPNITPHHPGNIAQPTLHRCPSPPSSQVNNQHRKSQVLLLQKPTPHAAPACQSYTQTIHLGDRKPPAKGITLYLVVIGLLTLLLTLLKPETRTPHIHSLADKPSLIYIFQRTGTYAFALFPVVILFSTRNNLLLLLGQKLPIILNNSFSHSTYLILHRWIGLLVALLAVIHSVLALPLYIDSDEPVIIHFPFWIWGSIAAVALSALVLLGSAYFRRRFYEPFLLGHILLSIVVLVGCWYHVQDLRLSGIAPCAGWLLAAVGICGLDRLVRTVCVMMNGVHKARVTEFGNNGEYVRVDIPLDSNGTAWGRRGLLARPGVHVYAQFPSLDGWKRPWQNHPFSVVPSSLLEGTGGESGSSSPTDERFVSINGPDGDAEKGLEVRVAELHVKTSTTDTGSGLTLLVKRSKGVTRHFKACGNLLTLLDGPYPNNSTTAVLSCERLLLIGGGIDITAVLPWIAHHSNVKLAWSMKESARCIVEQVEPALGRVAEKDVRIGRRLDLEKLLADEMELGWSRVGVVVSGPVGLCDYVRVAVASAGRKTQGETVFELEVDAYSW